LTCLSLLSLTRLSALHLWQLLPLTLTLPNGSPGKSAQKSAQKTGQPRAVTPGKSPRPSRKPAKSSPSLTGSGSGSGSSRGGDVEAEEEAEAAMDPLVLASQLKDLLGVTADYGSPQRALAASSKEGRRRGPGAPHAEGLGNDDRTAFSSAAMSPGDGSSSSSSSSSNNNLCNASDTPLKRL